MSVRYLLHSAGGFSGTGPVFDPILLLLQGPLGNHSRELSNTEQVCAADFSKSWRSLLTLYVTLKLVKTRSEGKTLLNIFLTYPTNICSKV